MKPTILKVFSNYPEKLGFNTKNHNENQFIKISNFENQTVSENKHEIFSKNFCETKYLNDDIIIESSEEVSILEDYYRFQQRRSAYIDSKKSQSQCNQYQQRHIHERPNFSYTQLIYMAIESSDMKALTVNDIYTWCEVNFPYYANAVHGWKNSLRHNLSINKCFKKITKLGQGGRGSLWIIDPNERHHLASTMYRAKVPSFTGPLIIRTGSSTPSIVTDPLTMAVSHEFDITVSDDILTSYQVKEEPSVSLIDKSPLDWSETRLPSELVMTEDCDDNNNQLSDASDTDYNDWKRSMTSLQDVVPPMSTGMVTMTTKNRHWQHNNASVPVVTPPTSTEHNYSIPDFHSVLLDDHNTVIRQQSTDSNMSYCTSSDYNDEVWPRTPPSPVELLPQQPCIISNIGCSRTSYAQQPKQNPAFQASIPSTKSLLRPPGVNKPVLKRGRSKKSIQAINNNKNIPPVSSISNGKSTVNRNVLINNMYNLNSFINSL